ncbi:MAG: NAD-dependent deacylase [Firmicutes bacterium]|nr:NAD-dependent deacylase [Bacillota bacterium]
MAPELQQQIQQLAAAMRQSRRTVVLTGAGASTEAGLPDWRGPAGIWKQWNPAQIASLSAMRKHPVDFYQFYRYRLATLRGAKPGPVHRAMAALEQAGYVHCIITQNIDRLHQAAGSREVVEVHGNLDRAHCVECGAEYPPTALEVEVQTEADIPRCQRCGGLLKPGIVLFEEPLPEEAISRAFAESRQADLFLVVGSSLEVGPVNLTPRVAVDHGARLGILNLSPTYVDSLATWVIREKAGPVLLAVARELGVEVEGGT